MFEESEGKTTISFRMNPKLSDKFRELVHYQYGHGGVSKVLEKIVKSYLDKFDDSIEQTDPIRTAPSIMADLETEIIPFLKLLDLQVISSTKNNDGMLQGQLEFVLNNCREASIYARALRVRRVMGTTSFETQKQTTMTYDEAYKMIKQENMEEHMNRRLYEIHFETMRNNNEK
jgi:hypothetical protein